VLIVLIAIPVQQVWGRSTSSPTPPQPSPTPGIQFAIPALDEWLNTDPSGISRGAVTLDGYRLFAIAAPGLGSAQATADPNPVKARIQVIEDRLRHIVNSNFAPGSLQVTSSIDSTSNQPIVSIGYRAGGTDHNDELITVTTLDAQIHSTTPEAWAEEVAQITEAALIRAEQERQPAFLKQRTVWAGSILLVAGFLSLIATFLQQHLRQERQQLSAQSQATTQQIADALDENNPAVPINLTSLLLQHQMDNQQRRGVNEIQRRLLQVAQTAIWGVGIYVILGLFPYTRWLQLTLLSWLQIPLKLFIIAVIVYILVRLSEVLTDRLFWVLQNSTSLAPEASQRIALRFSTFARVGKSVLALLLIASGVVIALSVVGVQVGPLLAGAGIIGLGISFASQSLIKDMINGFLILLEDQYGVGDVIIVGEVSGLVENMNLRITQLRNEEGRLITIPNSVITIVQNLSKEWSRVDLQVSVGYDADLNQALAVIDDVAQTMSRDRQWEDLILEKPLLLGVDRMDHMGVTIRLWIKTKPLKQWEVAREYRRRLKLAFDDVGIPIGIPQQSLWFHNQSQIADSDGMPNLGTQVK
jgi:small conductance mechanosensitive channel